jgi:hypothetical protein
MNKYFNKLNNKLRKHFKHDFEGFASYSDNCIFIHDAKISAQLKEFIQLKLGSLFNETQYNTTSSGLPSFRTLGFRWKVDGKHIKIRKPGKIKQDNSYYIHLLGRRNLMKIKIGEQLKLFCDGQSNNEQAHSAAGLYQNTGTPIMGIQRQRANTDQLCAEAYSLVLADNMRKALPRNMRDMIIHTDSNILCTIQKNKRARTTMESYIIQHIDNIKHVTSTENKADNLTRSEIDLFTKRKAPKRPQELELEGKVSHNVTEAKRTSLPTQTQSRNIKVHFLD